jgi:hypothetical protein
MMHCSTARWMALLAGSYACTAYLRVRNMLSITTGARHLRGRDHAYVGMWRTYREQLLQNIPAQSRHIVGNYYGIYRYRTDTPFATVTEYTGMEPTYRKQMLQNTQ